MITQRAHSASESFSYEGYGSDENSARAALLEGLQRHARELNVAEDFVSEQMVLLEMHEIHVGRICFSDLDRACPGVTIMSLEAEGEPGWRAFCDYRHPELGWGYLDTYATTGDEARKLLVQAIDRLLVDDENNTIRRADIIEAVGVYPVRDGGAYRGGMIGTAGEPLLDDHLEPQLPAESAEWHPTVHCELCVMTPTGQILSTATATSYPSRQNRIGISSFIENELQDARHALERGISFEPIRQDVDDKVSEVVMDMIIAALMTRRGERMHREVDVAGVKLLVTFRPEPTTAASLTKPVSQS